MLILILKSKLELYFVTFYTVWYRCTRSRRVDPKMDNSFMNVVKINVSATAM